LKKCQFFYSNVILVSLFFPPWIYQEVVESIRFHASACPKSYMPGFFHQLEFPNFSGHGLTKRLAELNPPGLKIRFCLQFVACTTVYFRPPLSLSLFLFILAVASRPLISPFPFFDPIRAFFFFGHPARKESDFIERLPHSLFTLARDFSNGIVVFFCNLTAHLLSFLFLFNDLSEEAILPFSSSPFDWAFFGGAYPGSSCSGSPPQTWFSVCQRTCLVLNKPPPPSRPPGLYHFSKPICPILFLSKSAPFPFLPTRILDRF